MMKNTTSLEAFHKRILFQPLEILLSFPEQKNVKTTACSRTKISSLPTKTLKPYVNGNHEKTPLRQNKGLKQMRRKISDLSFQINSTIMFYSLSFTISILASPAITHVSIPFVLFNNADSRLSRAYDPEDE